MEREVALLQLDSRSAHTNNSINRRSKLHKDLHSMNTTCALHDKYKSKKGSSIRSYPLVLCPIHVIFDLKNRASQVSPTRQTVACKGDW